MTNTNKPSTVFWIIGIIALIWNVMGVAAYLGQAYMTDEVLAAMPQADQDYFADLPAWVTAAFAISVFAGFIGCVMLLLRKKLAALLLLISLIGVLAQNVYNFFMQDYIELTGSRMAMPIVVIAVCIFLAWYSRDLKSKGILT
ncbi:MAG: hypothetical protein ACWA5P_11610 [bacterium]